MNLELPLRLSDRLGGHLVQGHVDGIGVISSVVRQSSSWLVVVQFPAEFRRYVIPVGSIALDGKEAGSKSARLRWFIVAPEFQKRGIGRRLILETVDFCRKAAYGRIYLWTFKGLDRARSLYESEGFRLAEEHDIRQWRNSITEQMFLLDLNA